MYVSLFPTYPPYIGVSSWALILLGQHQDHSISTRTFILLVQYLYALIPTRIFIFLVQYLDTSIYTGNGIPSTIPRRTLILLVQYLWILTRTFILLVQYLDSKIPTRTFMLLVQYLDTSITLIYTHTWIPRCINIYKFNYLACESNQLSTFVATFFLCYTHAYGISPCSSDTNSIPVWAIILHVQYLDTYNNFHTGRIIPRYPDT
jgi:hypothetical protein